MQLLTSIINSLFDRRKLVTPKELDFQEYQALKQKPLRTPGELRRIIELEREYPQFKLK